MNGHDLFAHDPLSLAVAALVGLVILVAGWRDLERQKPQPRHRMPRARRWRS